MSTCSFKIPLQAPPDQVVQKIKTMILKAGGTMSGDDAYGELSVSTPLGSVSGTYRIVNNEVNIIITKKPLFVSCRNIESILRKKLPNL
jgi:hypothetical protein